MEKHNTNYYPDLFQFNGNRSWLNSLCPNVLCYVLALSFLDTPVFFLFFFFTIIDDFSLKILNLENVNYFAKINYYLLKKIARSTNILPVS